MSTERASGLRIIPIPEGARRLNRGVSTLYDQLNPASANFNPRLPQRVRDGSNVGLIEHEIDDYILGLMQARGGVGGP